MRYILHIIVLSLVISSCKEGVEDNKLMEFEVEVLGKGSDCGDLHVVKILNNENQFYQEVETNAFNQAYVLNLEEAYKVSGLRMRVILQKSSESDELIACTMMGPSYPQVKIIEIKELLNCEESKKAACECYENYAPVCGCNGNTYPNACYAECHGITIFKEGECK